MKSLPVSQRFVLSLLALLLFFSSYATAQQKKLTIKNDIPSLSPHQQDALDLMKGLSQELKSESDKLTAASLQARIADVLWKHDESLARDVFKWAFDSARKRPSDDVPRAELATYAVRQAASIREILTRLGMHDQQLADAWFKMLEEEKAIETRSSDMGQFRSELLIQLALQLVPTNPAQAQRLGLMSLSGSKIPDDFGSLLFALSNVSRSQSNELFRAAIACWRRNEFIYDIALISLVNYLFNADGTLHSTASIADARLLANYFVDAAWRQPRSAAGVPNLPDSSASFYNFVEMRGLPIVSQYAAPRLPELQGQLREMASRLSQDQLQNAAQMRATQQQQATFANANSYDTEERIERALKEKDIQVRDALLNSIAHSLMRSDNERALKVAAMIDDAETRAQAEDDIYLVKIQQQLLSRSYADARKTTSKLKNTILQAKVLVQLASKALAENKDTGLATELLSEAAEITSKHEPVADKLMSLLVIAQQFAKFDAVRGFEILGVAIKTVNQLKSEDPARRSVLTKPRLVRIKTYTVINGSEMSTSDRATFDSIDFGEVVPFVAHDYLQVKMLGNKIENPLRRARFLTAVASAALQELSHKKHKISSKGSSETKAKCSQNAEPCL